MVRKLLFISSLLMLFSSLFAQSGTNIFNNTSVHTIKMYTSFPNYWDTMTVRYMESIGMGGASTGSNKPILFDSIIIDGTHIDSCGVKQKGFYSNWGADTSLKKPLKIEFNEFVSGQRYDGLKDLNLANAFQDPTMMHDHVSYKVLRDYNLPAPRTSYANVYINDVLWSIYVLVEQVGPKFLDEHFGDNNGNLYKTISTDLNYLGPTATPYKDEFEKKNNESLDDWSDLIHLVNVINTKHIDSVNKILNVDQFLKTLAVDVSLNNWDSYFEHGRNFYLYNDTITHRFLWIPWDYNLAFDDDDYEILLPDSRPRKPLINKCFNIPAWKNKYFSYLCDVNNNLLTLSHLESFIDDTKSLIEISVANDPNSFYTYPQFDSSIYNEVKLVTEFVPGLYDTTYKKGLKRFIVEKQVYILDQLSLEFYSCDSTSTDITNPIIENSKMIQIVPNPSADFIQFITLDGPLNEGLMSIYSMDGSLIRKDLIHSNLIDISNLNSGIYVVQLIRNNTIHKGKLLVQH